MLARSVRQTFRVVFILVIVLAVPGSARGATFPVNSSDDLDDGACSVTHCSLREAINAANANPGTDMIEFNISGAGPHTIQPTSALPTITDPVIIDGYTQPGASPNTNPITLGSNAVLKIELDGTNAGSSSSGLFITGGNSIVRGLVINRFARRGIFLRSIGGNVIEGNFIGTNVMGTFTLGNIDHGVTVDFSPGNIIGGTVPEARNVISGNGFFGIAIRFVESTGNLVQGNFIGTDVTGMLDLGNASVGVGTAASNTIIGGITPGARNIISGNGGGGVLLAGVGQGVTSNVVQGNFIGTNLTGTSALGNSGSGIVIFDNADCLIGGTTQGAANIIAANRGVGVLVSCGTGNAILSNSIFSNVGLGIDLGRTIPGQNPPCGADGNTPNDAGDGDTGANNLQNFPVLTSASGGPRGILNPSRPHTTVVIEGTLNSTPNTEFRLEFFSNKFCANLFRDNEGETLLGATTVMTDGNGEANFKASFPETVPPGPFITATATDPNGNTSEFSPCIEQRTQFGQTNATVLIANFMNGNNTVLNSRIYLWNPSQSGGNVTVRVFTLGRGGASTFLGTVDLGNLETFSARNIKLAEDILAPLGIPLPYTDNGGNLTLEFTIGAANVRGAGQVFSDNVAFGTYPLQEIPPTAAGPTVLVANFMNGNDEALNSRVYLWNPSSIARNVTARVFTLERTGISTLLGTVDLGSLEAFSGRNIKLAEDILLPLEIALPYRDNGGNLTLEFTIGGPHVRGVAQVFSDSLAFGTYPLQVTPSFPTSSTRPVVLAANFTNGNTDFLKSRVYLWNPSTGAGEITVRVFTLPVIGGLARELTTSPFSLGTLEARSALNLKVAEDILIPLEIPTPYTTDGGNLTLEFTIQEPADARGAAQVFSDSLAFGTYPLQEIPSTSSGSPTVLVANFMNGNTDFFKSRVYLWNPSASAGNVSVRVFTLEPTGLSTLLGMVDLGSLGPESALNVKLAEDILTPLGLLPYTDNGGNLTLEFTIEAANVRGAGQVFSDNVAFGTYPLQVIQ